MLNEFAIVGRLKEEPTVISDDINNHKSKIIVSVMRTTKDEKGIYGCDDIECEVNLGMSQEICKRAYKGKIVGVKGKISVEKGFIKLVSTKITILNDRELDEQ